MPPAPSRRDLLRTLLVGAAGAVCPAFRPGASYAQEHSGHLIATRLADNLVLVSGGGGNVVAVAADEGVALINGGSREHSSAVLSLVSEHTGGKAVRHLFNTDWHPDHTGSNETLGRSGAQIIAHENTKQYLGADVFVDWQKRKYKALPSVARPARTFWTSDKMTIGRERVEFGALGQAHTDGDIYVHFPDANVLVAGDVLAVGTYPIADYISGGWLGGLMNATKTLLDLANEQTRVIPGHGPVQTRADLKVQHEMLVTLRERLHQMMRKGMGPNDMLAAGATKEFEPRCGDPALFIPVTYRGLWLHVRELGGIV